MDPETYGTLLVYIATLTALAVAGCAPVISRGSLREVDQGVRFEHLLKNPPAYRGRTVLLGGDIIETQNLPGKTLLVVLQRSLGFRGRPAAEGASKGRFIVCVPGFLDPAIYRPTRKVTVVGSVSGKEVRPLGEIEYTYPVITKRELYIWPLEGSPAAQPRVRFGVGVGVGL